VACFGTPFTVDVVGFHDAPPVSEFAGKAFRLDPLATRRDDSLCVSGGSVRILPSIRWPGWNAQSTSGSSV